jgi:uncharacterized membrane protein
MSKMNGKAMVRWIAGASIVILSACSGSTEQSPRAEPVSSAGACFDQDGRPVSEKIRAVGTEPFWSAEVSGRCVTYATPEDQSGTRIWTRITQIGGEMTWDGALNSKQFKLVVRPANACSDGMSDKVYPLEAVLRVNGDTRRGCAERN